MKNTFKRVWSSLCCLLLVMSTSACVIGDLDSSSSSSDPNSGSSDSSTTKPSGWADVTSNIIDDDDTPLILQYDEEAPAINECSAMANGTEGADIGWQEWSLPLGNGYFGANVFGRTENERIQISEKSLANPWRALDPTTNKMVELGGLNNFTETYLDFNHANNKVDHYRRYLDLRTAISGVSYDYNGVAYTREYFTSYPDNIMVIRLTSNREGALDFVLRPTIPYEQSYMKFPGDGLSKTGTVVSSVEDGVGCIELSGTLGYFDVDFVGLYRVFTNGGKMSATTTRHTYKDTANEEHSDVDGTITVTGANDAYIVISLGTDYELNSQIFLGSETDRTTRPTFKTDLSYARQKVQNNLDDVLSLIENKSVHRGYEILKERHIDDYSSMFGRVSLNLNFNKKDLEETTDVLLEEYQSGRYSSYMEALEFQYGRYLQIASSRPGTLPSHLQGAWNSYNYPPWSSGYWHNINIQMNYWATFTTNLVECFEAYVAFNQAYLEKARIQADDIVRTYNASMYGQDGGNGWTIGVAANPYFITSNRSSGDTAFTTQLLWEYYQYTKDEDILNFVYDTLSDAARYITKSVKLNEEGYYLVEYCDSPEQFVNGKWYYTTGSTYAQSFSYLNNNHTLLLAQDLGIDLQDETVFNDNRYSVLKTIMNQIDKYDPINIGLSGQIKEFREEDYYGSVGDPNHRHMSHLVGLYPGNLINSNTPAWLDAASVALYGRRNANPIGWSYAHKSALYARLKDGDNAYKNYASIINETAPNLFCIMKTDQKVVGCFQVDANFGAATNVGEMLLQSHEGYIEPLAALPSQWSKGSYKGLSTRGNFEVSARWDNGVATDFNILSKKGEKASIKYPSITNAKVYTKEGKPVSFEISGEDIITFDTVAGETYVITGLTKVERPNAPITMQSNKTQENTFNLTWAPVANAVSYNVYVAVGNAATYTLVGNTTNTNFVYTPSNDTENTRTTFAVTAVGANGKESKRILYYYNPA